MAPLPTPAPLGPQLGRTSALSRFVDVHPGEGRLVAGASVVLALIVAAHVLLETARDAVFLTKLSPNALPAVYVAMGALGFMTAGLDRVSSRLVGRKNALVLGLM